MALPPLSFVEFSILVGFPMLDMDNCCLLSFILLLHPYRCHCFYPYDHRFIILTNGFQNVAWLICWNYILGASELDRPSGSGSLDDSGRPTKRARTEGLVGALIDLNVPAGGYWSKFMMGGICIYFGRVQVVQSSLTERASSPSIGHHHGSLQMQFFFFFWSFPNLFLSLIFPTFPWREVGIWIPRCFNFIFIFSP